MTDSIKDKVRKLLQLAASDNVNEAALAMSMAQDLMDKHNLQMAELSKDESISLEDIIEDDQPLFSAGRIPGWKSILGNILAVHNNCRLIITHVGDRKERITNIVIFGRPSDIDHVRFMFAYALTQLTRLAYIPCVGEGHRFKDSWYHGAVMGISDKLHEMKSKTMEAASKYAVNTYNSWGEDVKDFVNNKYNKLRVVKSNSKINSDAHARGRVAGRSIDLGGSKSIKGKSTISMH